MDLPVLDAVQAGEPAAERGGGRGAVLHLPQEHHLLHLPQEHLHLHLPDRRLQVLQSARPQTAGETDKLASHPELGGEETALELPDNCFINFH